MRGVTVLLKIKFSAALHLIHWPSASHPAYKELDYNVMREIVLDAEKLGYYAIWAPDHLMEKDEEFELWTIFSFLASITKKIRFHPGVLSNSFRHPSVLAKMAATFDVISDGRLDFGIGAGWNIKEHDAYGIPLPKIKTRIKILEEAVRLIKSMWTKDKISFQGKYYGLKNAVCEPKPIQKPHPPITIGGGGEKYTLRVVAKLADRCNFIRTPSLRAQKSREPERFWDPILSLQEYKNKLEVLKRHCRDVNRDINEIEKTIWTHVLIAKNEKQLKKKLSNIIPRNFPIEEFVARRIVGTPEQCIQKIKSYTDEAGITYFHLGFMDLPRREGIKLFAKEVIPAFS